MDELHRLYEHQTMMAIGIYSFLDNLLAHIPSRPELDASTAPIASDTPETLDQAESTRLRAELSGNLIDIARASSIVREIPDRLRLLPRLSTWSIHGSLSTRPDENGELNMGESRSSEESIRLSEPTEPVNKVDVTPGGYPEEIFIYLSDREKQEYMCTVCYSVLKEPYQCQNEHRFCYGCIYTWSTGPSIGHDGCPVCRCDGLYAKNFDLIDRINRKRVRCLASGCNWMGVLSEYATHEHRRYSPYELDILISSCSKETLLKDGVNKDKTSKQEAILEETIRVNSPAKPEQAIITEVDNVDLVPLVGSMPVTCEPVTTSLEETEPNRLIQSQPPRGLTRLRRRCTGTNRDVTPSPASSPSRARRGLHTRRNATVTSTNVAVTQPHLNRVPAQCTPTRMATRPSLNAQVSMPNIHRPLVTLRNTRHTTTTSSGSSQHEYVSRPPVLQPRRVIRRTSHNISRQSLSSSESEMQQATEAIRDLGNRNTVGSTNTGPRCQTATTTPGGLRNSEENNRNIEPVSSPTTNLIRSQVVSPPPVISTDSPPSSTFLAARNQMFPIRSASDGTTHASAQRRSTVETEQPDRRNESCVLPAINPNATLTTSLNGPPSYEQPPNSQSNEDNVHENTAEPNTDELGNENLAGNSLRRPLEFRRLVPRRQGRVVEQLRETREQLAAMLRLMTMELEERRQHVIAATFDASTRSRRVSNVNNHLSNQLDTNTTDMNAESGSSTTTTDPLSMQDRQNHNASRSWNILRNLPTPDRTPTTQRLPLRLLRLTTTTTTETEEEPTTSTAQREFIPNRWAAYPTVTNPSLVSTAEEDEDDVRGEDEEEDRPNRSISPILSSRLLTRLRLGSASQTPAPPILLVSRRRNLSTLLSELRYANATAAAYGGWSSDDEEEQASGT